MRINGFWSVGTGKVSRPFITAYAFDTDGKKRDITFMVDSGADETVLDFDNYVKLGLSSLPSIETKLEGIGGTAAGVTVRVKLRFTKDDGVPIDVNIDLTACTEPTSLGMNLLGRDVLEHFSLIIDKPGDTVCLLHGLHRYVIQES